MKRIYVVLLFGAAIIGRSRVAVSQDLRSLDTDIHHVVSGGWWGKADGGGWYRAIIRTGGFEHTVSDLTLQWIRERSGDIDPNSQKSHGRVIRSVLLHPCTGRLDDPVLKMRGTTWLLTVLCTDTHGDEKPVNVMIRLGAPGTYAVLEPK